METLNIYEIPTSHQRIISTENQHNIIHKENEKYITRPTYMKIGHLNAGKMTTKHMIFASQTSISRRQNNKATFKLLHTCKHSKSLFYTIIGYSLFS